MTDHETCRDCGEQPRAGHGRWLCERCEDAMFGTPEAAASDLSRADMEVAREAA